MEHKERGRECPISKKITDLKFTVSSYFIVSGHATGPSSHYRPAFLDHFDKSGEAQKKIGGNAEQAQAQLPAPSAPPAPATTSAEQAGFEHQFAQVKIFTER